MCMSLSTFKWSVRKYSLHSLIPHHLSNANFNAKYESIDKSVFADKNTKHPVPLFNIEVS